MKFAAAVMALVWGWTAGAAFGEWPERDLTLVAPLSPTLPWGQTSNPQAELLAALVPRLSRELGVPVRYQVRPEGMGVLAANAVALAQDDGYVLTAIGNDPAVSLVIQGYTPYIWGEIVPVATAWRVVYVLVAGAGFPASDIRALADNVKAGTKNSRAWDRPRLARVRSGPPFSSSVLMAMEAAREAGFEWDFAVVDRLDPEVILEGRAEAMVLPLGDFQAHPRKDEFKALLVMSEEEPYGAEGWPNLKTQALKLSINPFFAFYLPARVNWRVRSRLSTAINNTLRRKAVAENLVRIGLLPYLEDSEGVEPILNQEYANQVRLLESFGLMESVSGTGPVER